MTVDTPATARAFLAAWGGHPRPGILAATLDGLRTARALDVTYGRPTADVDGAIAVLEAARPAA